MERYILYLSNLTNHFILILYNSMLTLQRLKVAQPVLGLKVKMIISRFRFSISTSC